jgi:ABC-type amino acid transport system permease subunit
MNWSLAFDPLLSWPWLAVWLTPLAILAIVGLTYAALALIVSAIVRLIERRLAVDR